VESIQADFPSTEDGNTPLVLPDATITLTSAEATHGPLTIPEPTVSITMTPKPSSSPPMELAPKVPYMVQKAFQKQAPSLRLGVSMLQPAQNPADQTCSKKPIIKVDSSSPMVVSKVQGNWPASTGNWPAATGVPVIVKYPKGSLPSTIRIAKPNGPVRTIIAQGPIQRSMPVAQNSQGPIQTSLLVAQNPHGPSQTVIPIAQTPHGPIATSMSVAQNPLGPSQTTIPLAQEEHGPIQTGAHAAQILNGSIQTVAPKPHPFKPVITLRPIRPVIAPGKPILTRPPLNIANSIANRSGARFLMLSKPQASTTLAPPNQLSLNSAMLTPKPLPVVKKIVAPTSNRSLLLSPADSPTHQAPVNAVPVSILIKERKI